MLQKVKCSDSTALHCVFGKNETPTQGGGQHGSVAHQLGVILPNGLDNVNFDIWSVAIWPRLSSLILFLFIYKVNVNL